MATGKLTKAKIDGFIYSGAPVKNGWSRDIRWDSAIAGLGVRVYPESNKKSFVLAYRQHGRKRLMVLGRNGILTLDQARDTARRHLVSVGDGGPAAWLGTVISLVCLINPCGVTHPVKGPFLSF